MPAPERTWAEPGWLDIIGESGRTVIAPDLLGHGQAEKPHEAEPYARPGVGRFLGRLVEGAEVGLCVVALLGFVVYQKRSWFAKLFSRRKASIAALETSFGEAFCKHDEQEDETVKDDESTEARARVAEAYQEKDLEIESLKQQISQERVQHDLERMRREEYITQLEKRIGSKEVLEEAADEANLTYSS